MQRMTTGLISILAAAALATTGCKQRDDDRVIEQPTAEKRVEQAQQQTEEAYDRAKEAQQRATDEHEEAVEAQEKVVEKQQELAEAQQKAAASQAEARTAQEQARVEGQAAHQEVQSAQQQAAEAQAMQEREAAQLNQQRAAESQQVATESQQRAAESTQKIETTEPARPPTSEPLRTGTQPSAVTDKPALATGELRSFTADEIILDRPGAGAFHIKLDPQKTTVMNNGETAQLSSLPQGTQVVVSYRIVNNQAIAERIEAKSPVSPQ